MQFGHHIGLARNEQLLEDGFGRRERYHRQRIAVSYLLEEQVLQRRYASRLFCLEVQFGFGNREFVFGIQYVVLHAHVGGMFHHAVVGLLHQGIHPAPVLVHVYVFVPFYAHHQLVLVYLGHAFLLHEVEEEYTQRQGSGRHQHTEFLMREYPLHALVVETFQPVVLHQVVETLGQQALSTDTRTIEQQVQHR